MNCLNFKQFCYHLLSFLGKWNSPSRDRKYIRTLLLVFFVIVFFAIPLVVIVLIEAVNGLSISVQNGRMVASFLCQATSIMNPIVYAWRNREFTNSFSKVFGNTFRSSSHCNSQATVSTIGGGGNGN